MLDHWGEGEPPAVDIPEPGTLVALGVLLWHPTSGDSIRELWVPFFKTAVITYMPWWLLLVLIMLILRLQLKVLLRQVGLVAELMAQEYRVALKIVWYN